MRGHTVLAVDPGETRIGLAISDPSGAVALPLEVIDSRADPISLIADLVREQAVAEVVVGLPKTLRGEEGRAAQKARIFAGDLEKQLEVTVSLIDERFTTMDAARALKEMGRGAKARRNMTDMVAATLLLQGYLDSSP